MQWELGVAQGFLECRSKCLVYIEGFFERAQNPDDRHKIESIVSAEFRLNSKQIDRKNFVYIEYLLRLGKKQLDQLKSPDT
ncbi:hypothetical protein Nepgr_015908 [Nepenthes gracilis]|uniref:Complex 1 LYR protein domain-containing protein n=1 Tax=Nepenthes gracilis TaxID=150966 RepID=A0AAD3XQT5_NEPGR|nr:hypothetical protein Nepgr_015908 [Nepenthes gracilis]